MTIILYGHYSEAQGRFTPVYHSLKSHLQGIFVIILLHISTMKTNTTYVFATPS